MKVETLVLGPLPNNSYIVYDEETGRGLVIDPTFHADAILSRIRKLNVSVEKILLTHGHADHIAGLSAVHAAWPEAEVYMNAGDRAYLTDPRLNLSLYMAPQPVVYRGPWTETSEGDAISVGDMTFHVLETPGHTPGGVSYFVKESGIVFTGDSLFEGSIGRTDFPGGDLRTLVTAVKEKLLTLPPETIVLSGHGNPTSIQAEKVYNPFLTGVL
jgi:hydroxyacylglutathione hydrolase